MSLRMRTQDWIALGRSTAELTEMASTANISLVVDRLLSQICELLDIENALLTLSVQNLDSEDDGVAAWIPMTTYRFGPDAERFTEVADAWFGIDRNFEKDPATDQLARTAGHPRAFLRADAIDESAWQHSPMQELYEALGVSDRITGGSPAGAGTELVVVGYRRGKQVFREAERELLHAFLSLIEPAGRRLALAHGLAPRSQRLAPRERQALRHLLQGLAEQEIATAMSLTPRTLHQYVVPSTGS